MTSNLGGIGVTVVIPCFNGGRQLVHAIASLLAQSFLPHEIIVVDDGSTDGSAGIARRCAMSSAVPIKVHAQANAGVAAARNAGLRMAAGNVIAFLDADDRWPDHSLEVRLNGMQATAADIVFGRVCVVHRRGLVTVSSSAPIPGRLAGSMIVRRDVFARIGEFDESLRTAETIEWIARAGEAGVRMEAVDNVVLHRIVHGENMMLTNDGQIQDRLAVLRAAARRRRHPVAI